MAHESLTDFWRSLPEGLKEKLRLGFTGKAHLLDVAGWCLRSDDSALRPLAADALVSAFAEHPLDGGMAGELLAMEATRALLPPPVATAMAVLAEHWRRPDNTGYFDRLLARRDFPKIKHFIAQSASREPDNLFWREQGVAFGLIDNDPDWVDALLGFTPPHGLEPVLAAVRSQVARVRGEHGEAARLACLTGPVLGQPHADMLAGLHQLEQDPASGALLLLQALAARPWDMNLLLRVHDRLTGLDAEQCPLAGSVAVLLYTWNKDRELSATLGSLFGSELSDVSIFVLDNGSDDRTGEVLAKWVDRFDERLGKDRFHVMTLPVNVGAPAARNWLMHHEPVTRHDFICYLDDDVELPPDWLLRFGAAVNRYPDAGVWGCKVVDHANPALIQSADAHLLVDPDAHGVDLARTAPNPFKLSDLPIQSLDTGRFDSLRPCASVTGCCHLFRTDTLLESGDFAIHLSPSQYDDMEHDLRLCLTGQYPVCQGHLAVRHKKRTGAAARVSTQQEGNALGNKYKMQTMFERADLAEAARAEQAVLEADLRRKFGVVEQALKG